MQEHGKVQLSVWDETTEECVQQTTKYIVSMKVKFSYSKKMCRGQGEDYINLSFLVAGPAGPSLPAWQRRQQSCLAELQHTMGG